ncbi:NAD-dependent epimerase/dehydratase family protein [Euhalothece natronophila Z-M001]|uniref:NAD-dependent epimerase/dehydratase family protein n=1 Tax=Euhalothece natronophila Z-M001 TaxID=522448 RepID=A0A5B8NJF9_9CHRO|nr:CIA30 family protein [Euhalothece natronophila]QDZ38480.1 NAD-dependent epimerase/dehydratase family protein [Euhalothece natronophila Z-M001]
MSQKKSWNIIRFFQTLTYFDVIPFLSKIPGVKAMILDNQSTKTPEFKPSKTGTILVAGATGGVGKRVVRELQKQNYPVRALVRSIDRAQTILGENLDQRSEQAPSLEEGVISDQRSSAGSRIQFGSTDDFYEGDITIPESLKPELMKNVTAVICCTGTRIQPVEGDTPDRQKYYQGVKFYEPEVAESTPEAVEYKGIKNLVELASNSLRDPSFQPIFDFRNANEEMKAIWGALDDVVMGGVSASGFSVNDQRGIFSGNVSTDNNGGFASVRTRNFETPLNLSGYQGIYLKVKGDGNRYKFFLRCDPKWDSIGYASSFDTKKDTWQDIYLPFSEFKPVFRAKVVNEAPPVKENEIYSLQLMLSKFEYNQELNPYFQPGTFHLDIETIEAYGGEKTPQFIMISSAGVTRPGRNDLDLSQEPPAVQMNDQLGGILTWKLAGENSIRDSGLPYTIIRPCALTEETTPENLYLEQGDTLKGQVSRETISQLCLEILKAPEAVNKTFEVSKTSGNRLENWTQQLSSLQPDC